MDDILHDIGKQYEALYRAFEDRKSEAVYFTGICGKDYYPDPVRLMVVGRAPNGWTTLKNISSAEQMNKIAIYEFTDTSRADWVHAKNSRLYNEDESYSLERSAFWTRTADIWKSMADRLEPDGVHDRLELMHHIVWTNLYKISRPDNNPTGGMIKKQQDFCRRILEDEICYLKPRRILMITGSDWFEPFSGIFSDDEKIGVNKYKENEKNDIYVERTARYKGEDFESDCIITCRPEYRGKADFINDVMEHFQM